MPAKVGYLGKKLAFQYDRVCQDCLGFTGASQGDLPMDSLKDPSAAKAGVATNGRTLLLYSILLVIALWVFPSVLPRRDSTQRVDSPPFYGLERTITLSSLLIMTGVLITQNRQEKLAKQRAQLTLKLYLRTERKIASLTTLVEELCCELPNVGDQHKLGLPCKAMKLGFLP